jgi:hypothetical protein
MRLVIVSGCLGDLVAPQGRPVSNADSHHCTVRKDGSWGSLQSAGNLCNSTVTLITNNFSHARAISKKLLAISLINEQDYFVPTHHIIKVKVKVKSYYCKIYIVWLVIEYFVHRLFSSQIFKMLV